MKKHFLSILVAGLMLGGASQIQAMDDDNNANQSSWLKSVGHTIYWYVFSESRTFNERYTRAAVDKIKSMHGATSIRPLPTSDSSALPTYAFSIRNLLVQPEFNDLEEAYGFWLYQEMPEKECGAMSTAELKPIKFVPFLSPSYDESQDRYIERLQVQQQKLFIDALCDLNRSQQ